MLFKLMLFVLYLYLLVKNGKAVKCYVCGAENGNSCEYFDPNNASFAEYCGQDKLSCGLQIDGDRKIRSCEDVRLNDCQVANNVKYCYCTRDFCNGNSFLFAPSDDEDENVEGSGIISTTSIITTTTIIHPIIPTLVTITKSAKGSSSSNKFLIFSVPLILSYYTRLLMR